MSPAADSIYAPRNSRKRLAVSIAALLLLTVLAHLDGLNNGFLDWDDGDHVTENPHIKSFDLSMLRWAATSVDRHNWHPLTWITHAVDFALYGEDPRGYHLGNLILHCLNTLWVFALARTLLPLVWAPRQISAEHASQSLLLASFLGAALFGVHPQHVESVAWISERKDLLFLFFYLPSLICYIRFATADSREQRRGWYVAALACCGMSILSKPMAVSLPIVLLLLDVYPLKRAALTGSSRSNGRGAREFLQFIIEKLPFFAIALLSVAVTLRVHWNTMNALATNTPLHRFFNAFDGIAAYVRHWAIPLDLSPQYPYRFSQAEFDGWLSEYSLVILFALAVTALAVWLWRRGSRAALTGWAFYLVTLLPVLGIASVGSASSADRYAYLPTLPLHLGFGVLASWVLCNERLSKFVRIGASGLVVAVLGAMVHLSQEQTRLWRDDLTLWTHAVAITPHDFTTQLHAAHANVLTANYPGAAHHFERAFELKKTGRRDPFLSSMRLVFAQVLFNLGRYEDSTEVLSQIHGGVEPPLLLELHEGLALQFCSRGEFNSAGDQLEQATEIDPTRERTALLRRRLEAKGCLGK